MSSTTKISFAFDQSKRPEENIDLFYKHLESIEPELALLLKQYSAELISLPQGQERNSVRMKINSKIAEFLDRTHTKKESR